MSQITMPAAPSAPDSRTIAVKQTPLQKIELELIKDGSYALYLNGNIQFVSGHDDLVYHGMLASAPAAKFGGRPIRVLIMGGGDGLAARNLLRLPNVTGILMVEIDGEMVRFCREHPVLRWLNEDSFRNPRMSVIAGDARAFVRSRPRALFDLALMDFPDPEPEILDLFRADFYRALLRHMNPSRAVVAVQASTALSMTERLVTRELSSAMGCRAVPRRFRGRYMDDGVIVIGDTTQRR